MSASAHPPPPALILRPASPLGLQPTSATVTPSPLLSTGKYVSSAKSTLDAVSVSGPNGMLSATYGGKNNGDKQGWGNLPISLLHLILTKALEGLQLDQCLKQAWGGLEGSEELALVLVQRRWMCAMRYVSSGWRSAVDSHPFWPAYTLILDPSRHHSSTRLDLFSANLTPSTPSFPTLFHRSRHTTLSICLACRLNHPDRLGLYPAVPRHQSWSARFGLAPTCERHAGVTCNSCLRESASMGRTKAGKGGRGWPIVLREAETGDVDETGMYRPRGAMTCLTCRDLALMAHIVTVLREECSRGGPIKGIYADWKRTQAGELYLLEGQSNSIRAAHEAVSEQWFIDQTRWTELREPALLLQQHEQDLKFQLSFSGEVETPEQRLKRWHLLLELRGEDDEGDIEEAGGWFELENMELQTLYREWREDIEDDEDGSDASEADSVERHLNSRWIAKLRDACINDFINDRIKFGFWVSPSDEVRRLANPTSPTAKHHTIFADLGATARFPFGEGLTPHDIPPAMAYLEGVGCITFPPLTSTPDGEKRHYFLPPQRILADLDNAFAHKLRRTIWGPMCQAVDGLVSRCRGSEDLAERTAVAMPVRKILDLVADKRSWLREGWNDEDARGSKGEGKRRQSPRIEVVHVGQKEQVTVAQEWGIREVESGPDSPLEGPRLEGVSLGKRKSPPNDDGNTAVQHPAHDNGSQQPGSGKTASVVDDRAKERAVSVESTTRSSRTLSTLEAFFNDDADPFPANEYTPSELDEQDALFGLDGGESRTITAYESIPFVPRLPEDTESSLGPIAERLILGAWWDARARLRECKCAICERGKERNKRARFV